MIRLTPFQRLISLFIPVLVRKGSGTINPVLELYYFRGRWQLATRDALYSDGSRYSPLRLGFGAIKKHLSEIKQVVVLGTGLGSAVDVLDSMGYQPQITLVDLDETVLQWALEFQPTNRKHRLRGVAMDAELFVKKEKETCDLLVIDIFNSRNVPQFVTGTPFLTDCKALIRPGGHAIFNYIINHPEEWENAKVQIFSIFPNTRILENGINRILIASV